MSSANSCSIFLPWDNDGDALVRKVVSLDSTGEVAEVEDWNTEWCDDVFETACWYVESIGLEPVALGASVVMATFTRFVQREVERAHKAESIERCDGCWHPVYGGDLVCLNSQCRRPS